MKKITLLIALSLAAIVSVQAQVNNLSALGSPVARELSTEWIANRKACFSDVPVYYFDKGTVSQMLEASVSGVYIFNAIDGNNNETLVIKPACADGTMMDNGVGYMAATSWRLDISDLSVPDPKAAEMVERFQKEFQDNFHAHAYGRKAFDALMAEPGAEGISIMKGLDSNGEEHLILMAVDKDGQQLEYATIWNHGSGIFFLLYLQDKLGLAGK